MEWDQIKNQRMKNLKISLRKMFIKIM